VFPVVPAVYTGNWLRTNEDKVQ